jgi:hypothetical protein
MKKKCAKVNALVIETRKFTSNSKTPIFILPLQAILYQASLVWGFFLIFLAPFCVLGIVLDVCVSPASGRRLRRRSGTMM